MEGLYLHNLILLALGSKTNTITLYILLGWGELDFRLEPCNFNKFQRILYSNPVSLPRRSSLFGSSAMDRDTRNHGGHSLLDYQRQ